MKLKIKCSIWFMPIVQMCSYSNVWYSTVFIRCLDNFDNCVTLKLLWEKCGQRGCRKRPRHRDWIISYNYITSYWPDVKLHNPDSSLFTHKTTVCIRGLYKETVYELEHWITNHKALIVMIYHWNCRRFWSFNDELHPIRIYDFHLSRICGIHIGCIVDSISLNFIMILVVKVSVAGCGTCVYVPGPRRTGVMFSDELHWRAVFQWQLRRLSSMLEHTWIQYRSLWLIRFDWNS